MVRFLDHEGVACKPNAPDYTCEIELNIWILL